MCILHILGASSLVMTSTMSGEGQRRCPTSQSLLHATLALLGNPVLPTEIKTRALRLAAHATQALESRIILAKVSFFLSVICFLVTKNHSCIEDKKLGTVFKTENITKCGGFFI